MPSLSNTQLELLKEADLESTQLSSELIAQIATQANPQNLTDEQLLEFLQVCNALYRGGEPFISDADYDFVFLAELQKRHPHHPYLETVEPEVVAVGKTVTLPEPMLSTEKTYSQSGIEKWLSRLEKAAEDCDADFFTLMIRATPKLDGYAAYDDGKLLYTRGDGRKGTDISRVFERGLKVGGNGKRGQGAGEIVVSQTYFNNHLAEYFENSRNFQASIIKEKDLEQHALEAIQNHAAVFFPFSQLPDWQGTAAEVLADFDQVIEKVYSLVDYDVDGVVFRTGRQ
jgi:NAD-dependent DNA ligase adenylation domain.